MKTNLFGANALRPCIALLIGLLTVAPACTQKSANAQETASASPKVAQSVDRPEDLVRAEIVDGRVRLIAKTDELGWPERTHFVEGLTGRCVGLFVGDIGQDTCPYLCMLMDDGGVELLSYGIVNQGEGSVLDITQPLPTSRLPQSVECPEDPITARIAQGRVFLDVQKPFGAVEDRTYVLEGITGRCVGLFAGEIGRDKLFFLCLLMDDGGVEAFCPASISGFNPNSDADFISSGRLPDLKDITGFRQEGDAIQAIDKSGGKHALRPNLLPKPYRSLFHDVDGEEYELRIYPDWRLMFIDGSREGGTIACYAGQVFQTKADAKSGQYEFRYFMRSHTAFESGDTNPDIVEKTTPSTASGSFRLTTHDGGQTYDLVLLSGPALFRFKPGSPARFSIVSSYEGQPRWSEE